MNRSKSAAPPLSKAHAAAGHRADPGAKALARQVGVGGAVALGLGSMVGTGVFVSLGLSAGLVGPWVLAAVLLAGGLALCNGFSSAQLAAAHPVAGGTYEYAHRVGWPAAGFVAGTLFLLAKSASAATAALGLAAYVLKRFGQTAGDSLAVAGGLAVLAMITVVVLEGIRRANLANIVIVAVTFLGLSAFVGWGATQMQLFHLDPGRWAAAELSATGRPHPAVGEAASAGGTSQTPAALLDLVPWSGLPGAAALVFVAFTGYGRIATLGEEVIEPRRTIPRAIIVTVSICVVTYAAVAAVAIGAVGSAAFAAASEAGAPLETIAEDAEWPAAVGWSVTIAAVAAMAGVILNLLLGLSRVALAMGRRGHLPRTFARVHERGQTPAPAVLLAAGIVAALVAVGSIRTAWSFSAVTVLLYYAITNAAALKLPAADRLYPRAFSWVGLAGCLGLAAFVEPAYWVAAGITVATALLWHRLQPRIGADGS